MSGSNDIAAGSTEALNPRKWLARAPSSDLAFLHTVAEVTQRLAQQPGGIGERRQHQQRQQRQQQAALRIEDTRISGTGAQGPQAACAQCRVPARRASLSADGRSWLVEHAGGGHVSVVRDGVVTGSASGVGDVRCAWWASAQVAAVAAVTGGALRVHLVDGAEWAVLDGPPRGIVGPIIAQGPLVVCADSAGGLRFWELGAAGVVRSGSVDAGDPAVDLRWVAPGVGLAATRAGAFWFDVRAAVPAAGRHAPVRGVDPATVLSWRWQEAVVVARSADAAAAARFPPTAAELCLPSATGVAFHIIGQPGAAAPHALAFERGWVWLCGSSAAFAMLSPCRRKATVCRLPGGQPVYTVETHDQALIQDAWMSAGHPAACAISTGSTLYLLSFANVV